jgi:hypothetical protein
MNFVLTTASATTATLYLVAMFKLAFPAAKSRAVVGCALATGVAVSFLVALAQGTPLNGQNAAVCILGGIAGGGAPLRPPPRARAARTTKPTNSAPTPEPNRCRVPSNAFEKLSPLCRRSGSCRSRSRSPRSRPFSFPAASCWARTVAESRRSPWD